MSPTEDPLRSQHPLSFTTGMCSATSGHREVSAGLGYPCFLAQFVMTVLGRGTGQG